MRVWDTHGAARTHLFWCAGSYIISKAYTHEWRNFPDASVMEAAIWNLNCCRWHLLCTISYWIIYESCIRRWPLFWCQYKNLGFYRCLKTGKNVNITLWFDWLCSTVREILIFFHSSATNVSCHELYFPLFYTFFFVTNLCHTCIVLHSTSSYSPMPPENIHIYQHTWETF